MTVPQPPTYSVIVPTYQGQNTIRPLAQQLSAFFQQAKHTFEIIFVNDCGPDHSWRVMQEVQQEMGEDIIRIVRLARNFGQHNALICGFSHAQGRFFITMDEDLQHNPVDIGRLIEKQAIGDYDVVYGRYETLQHSGFRNITSKLLKKMLQAGIPELHPDYTAFRLLRADIARYCLQMSNSYTFLDGYLAWITANITSTTVSHEERTIGESSYTMKKLIEHSINIFVTFSDLPVRLLSLASIGIFGITSLYCVYVFLRKIMYNDFQPGFPSLIIALGFGIGLLLLGMGILGEYIHRINLKTTNRPNFIETAATE